MEPKQVKGPLGSYEPIQTGPPRRSKREWLKIFGTALGLSLVWYAIDSVIPSILLRFLIKIPVAMVAMMWAFRRE